MKKNLTEMVFILDKSGSMGGLESDTIGGFNAMIEKQKKQNGEAYVTTILFDNESQTVHDRVSLDKIKPMTDEDYVVGGCTALIDAIGMAVEHISKIHKYAREEDVPEKVVFVITTDGMENASRKFDSKTVKKMIEQKKELGWEFLFIGANIDAVETASHFGIDSSVVPVFTTGGSADQRNIKLIADGVSSGRGVILSVHADMLWYDAAVGLDDYHAVTVTSVKKNSAGDVRGFYICDSADGGTTYYPADKVIRCLTGAPMNVTQQIIR